MPRLATGEKPRKDASGIWSKRVRVCGRKCVVRLPLMRGKPDADERAAVIAELAKRLTLARTDRAVARDLLARVGAMAAGAKLSAEARDPAIAALHQMVNEAIGGWRPTSTSPLFRTICERWNSNELARLRPDDIKPRKAGSTIQASNANLAKHILPVIGDWPVDTITLEVCDRIKANVANVPQAGSRRQILQNLKTVLDICVILGLIKQSPLPAKWLPKTGKTRALQWLHPAEVQQLMAATAIEAEWRLLWGFMARNGTREGELLQLKVSQFDLGDRPNATAQPHQTKTGKRHFWKLAMGCAEALRRHVRIHDLHPDELMFCTPDGESINAKTVNLPDLLRAHLRLAGITRSELFERRAGSRNIVVHDLRATCTTVKMALGWSDNDIMRLTGHETSSELKKYKREADTLRDLDAGDFAPLYLAIPELRAAGGELAAAVAAEALAPVLTLQRPTAAVLEAPAQPAPGFGHALATHPGNPAQPLNSQHSIVELRTPPQPLGITENPMIHGQPVADDRRPAGPDGQSMASLQAQISALQALVVSGLAAQISGTVIAQLQAAGALAAAPVPAPVPARTAPRGRRR